METFIIYRWFASDPTDPTNTNVAVGTVGNRLLIRVWDGTSSLSVQLPPTETRKLMEGLTEATTVVRDRFPT